MSRDVQAVQVKDSQGRLITVEVDVTEINRHLAEQRQLEVEMEKAASEGIKLFRVAAVLLGLSFFN